MIKQIINNTFSLQIPEPFESMGAEDLQELSRNGGDPYRWGVRNRDNHVMIIALWKQYPALLARISDLKSIVKKNEQLTCKVYEGHGYRLLGFSSLQAGDEKAEGYCFSFSAEGVTQIVSNYLIKDGKTVYAFLCRGLEENMAADQAMFREVMKSLQYL